MTFSVMPSLATAPPGGPGRPVAVAHGVLPVGQGSAMIAVPSTMQPSLAPPIHPQQVQQRGPCPSPADVASQKDACLKGIADGLRQAQVQLDTQRQQCGEALKQQAEQKKQGAILNIEQELRQHEAALLQQYNERLLQLQQAAQQQRHDLEKQAIAITAQYHQEVVEQETHARQMQLKMEHDAVQQKFVSENAAQVQKYHAEMARLQPTPQAMPMAHPVPMQHAMPTHHNLIPTAAYAGAPPGGSYVPSVVGSVAAPVGFAVLPQHQKAGVALLGSVNGFPGSFHSPRGTLR